MEEPGYLKGDICNREDCNGIIDEHEKEGCCSCHLNPPCSYCETPSEYCPECDWDALEERDEKEDLRLSLITEAMEESWRQVLEESRKRRDEFWEKYQGKRKINKFEVIRNSHTHFSMELTGVFPVEEGISKYIHKLRGSFGGRFKYLNKEMGKFIYIAYTD